MGSYKRFAAIYDSLINGDIDYEDWSRKILGICKELNAGKQAYLDLACGTGNITELIAPYFNEVWGVDLSEEMLIEADDKLRGKRIKARFICQDISKLCLNRKFDLITCCLDSINYITSSEDVKRCFLAIESHLKDNGVFIFDINSHYKLTEILGNNTFTYSSEDVVYIWENSCEDDMVEMFLTFFVKSGRLYERFEEEHRERAYREEHIEKMLKESGLDIRMKLDNYNFSDIEKDSERITYVITKAI
jgi:SAM-dependent methyltransferase